MRFIAHDHVVVGTPHALTVTFVTRGLERRDHERMPPPLSGRSARDHEVEFELLPQLAAPLFAERGGHQHERGTHRTTQDVLLEHDAGFHRLPEPDLVGQDAAAAEVTQHLETRGLLMRITLDAPQRVQ